MTPEPSIPPLRDLPPGRLETHHAHLLSEIGRKPHPRPWRRGPAWTLPRVAAVAAASATAAAAIAVVVTWGHGAPAGPSAARPAGAPPALIYVSHASLLRVTPSSRDEYVPTLDGTFALSAYRQAHGSRVPLLVYVFARFEATTNGDRRRVAGEWVKTTRQRAVSSQTRDRVDSPRRTVYFVELRGHFVVRNAYYIGRAAPRGSVLTFTIDRRSGQILDFAFGRRGPDLSRLGRVHRFSLGNARQAR